MTSASKKSRQSEPDVDEGSSETYDPECALLARKLLGETLSEADELTLDKYLFLKRYPIQ
ncbi:hypothetical protein GCM10017056_53150 [Seohaeicola zhoushanensis]|uniref:Uncharacterized protein n=1 Tax=Seohaeicola zhoushanensis TaxID=1569283 RepID=A0A8J3H1E2_9RHOB|nr:hypothetical protein GCM10017056_48870 [Seohaeicola zhoushanensis]GHF76270.1 hypothetical protein GCM10017056_53150 [Seohaeicola zhoushanensis]